MKKIAVAVAATILTTLAFPVTGASARTTNVTARYIRSHLLHQSISYRTAHYRWTATLTGWDRIDRRKYGTQWYPKFSITGQCIRVPGRVCAEGVLQTVWDWLTTGGNHLPPELRPYRLSWFDTALSTGWRDVLKPCMTGAAGGWIGVRGVRSLMPVMIRGGYVVGQQVVESVQTLTGNAAKYATAGAALVTCVAGVVQQAL